MIQIYSIVISILFLWVVGILINTQSKNFNLERENTKLKRKSDLNFGRVNDSVIKNGILNQKLTTCIKIIEDHKLSIEAMFYKLEEMEQEKTYYQEKCFRIREDRNEF